MADRTKIRPPAPLTKASPVRVVETPPTVGERDTTAGDEISVGKTRSDWREAEFVRVIRQHGKHCWWRKALLCPCGTAETDQAALDCPDCNGSGYVYVQPQAIQAHMAQFDKKTNIYEKFGLYQSGTVMVTVEPKYRPGYRDSYELRDDVLPMNELLTKGNRRGQRSKLPTGVDSARFRIVNATAALYKCPSGELVALEQGLHFTITDEGWIRWTSLGNNTVTDGRQFSLHYDYHPIFLVDSWMHITRQDTSGRGAPRGTPRVIAHPVQAMAKLDFLLDANGLPSLEQMGQPTGFGPAEPDSA